ncbi:hypothetical protein BC936DRAFT_140372 [Jimgerdemannia flammicorona]|uniref:Uncharacterized protein n=1 Tax=Jimgerdemannia flammicorona TaxID=994334 RepID=A0A433AUF9_9FUNG|nr:hypothetical protein BC936DRAFT_140372 [Jimgerdemannia flammicorona]
MKHRGPRRSRGRRSSLLREGGAQEGDGSEFRMQEGNGSRERGGSIDWQASRFHTSEMLERITEEQSRVALDEGGCSVDHDRGAYQSARPLNKTTVDSFVSVKQGILSHTTFPVHIIHLLRTLHHMTGERIPIATHGSPNTRTNQRATFSSRETQMRDLPPRIPHKERSKHDMTNTYIEALMLANGGDYKLYNDVGLHARTRAGLERRQDVYLRVMNDRTKSTNGKTK